MEVASSIGVIVAVIIFGYLVLTPPPRKTLPPSPGYSVGEVFETPDGSPVARGGITTVLFLRSTCKFCAQSMPLYQRIAAAPKRGELMVISHESEEEMRKYLSEHGVVADRLVKADTDYLRRIRGTPTLLLVGPDERIITVELGLVDKPDRADEILELLAG